MKIIKDKLEIKEYINNLDVENLDIEDLKPFDDITQIIVIHTDDPGKEIVNVDEDIINSTKKIIVNIMYKTPIAIDVLSIFFDEVRKELEGTDIILSLEEDKEIENYKIEMFYSKKEL